MLIEVISGIPTANVNDFINRTVIVIDVLRATSNMITGLHNGASGIVPVDTIRQAKRLRQPNDLLGGERGCKRIVGFHLGNSPFEYRQEGVRNKRILMTTTNGTRVIQKSLKASHLLAGALLNAQACAKTALELNKDVFLVCAGTQESFSLEDGLCAGVIIEELTQLIRNSNGESETKATWQINDLGLAMHSSYLQLQSQLTEILLTCENGIKLTRLGFREDVIYCAQVNQLDVVPIWQLGMLVPFSSLALCSK